MINKAIVIGKEKLRQSLEVGPQPVPTHPVSTDSSTDPSTSGGLRRGHIRCQEVVSLFRCTELNDTNKDKE